MFSELPSALRTVVWPWKMLSKLPGHHWWVGVSRQHVGVIVDAAWPGAQPLRNDVAYTTGLIDDPGCRSLVSTFTWPSIDSSL